MHLSEGVLAAPVWIGCAAIAAVGVMRGMRDLHDERLPAAALLGAAFFVAASIHVPVGLGSAHLILNGLMGLVLGWAAVPVLLVALGLQAALLSFGGFAVLGANVLIMALPALAAHLLLRRFLTPDAPRRRLLAIGAVAGVIGVSGAALVASVLMLLSAGRQFEELLALIAVAHVPLAAIDATVTAVVVAALARVLPQALAAASPAATDRSKPAAPRTGGVVAGS